MFFAEQGKHPFGLDPALTWLTGPGCRLPSLGQQRALFKLGPKAQQVSQLSDYGLGNGGVGSPQTKGPGPSTSRTQKFGLGHKVRPSPSRTGHRKSQPCGKKLSHITPKNRPCRRRSSRGTRPQKDVWPGPAMGSCGPSGPWPLVPRGRPRSWPWWSKRVVSRPKKFLRQTRFVDTKEGQESPRGNPSARWPRQSGKPREQGVTALQPSQTKQPAADQEQPKSTPSSVLEEIPQGPFAQRHATLACSGRQCAVSLTPVPQHPNPQTANPGLQRQPDSKS